MANPAEIKEFSYSLEEDLICEVSKRPALYTAMKKSYKDSVLKDNNWLEIEKILNIQVPELKKKWKNIRDYYVRHKKNMPTGSAAKRKRCDERRMRCLTFLDSTYTLSRRTYSNIPGANNSQDVEEVSTVEDEEGFPVASPEEAGPSVADPSVAGPSVGDQSLVDISWEDPAIESTSLEATPALKMACPRRNKKSAQRDHILKELNKSRVERSALIKQMLEKERDPIDVFFEGIAATVKTLPTNLQIKAKREFNNLMCDLEEESLNLF